MDVEDDEVVAFHELARQAGQAFEVKDRVIEAEDKALGQKDRIIADLKLQLGHL